MDGISDLINSASSTSSISPSNPNKSALQQEDFFAIMIAEMINQDPLEPMDNQQFLNQLTQTQTLQATNKLADGIEALLLGQQISSAGSLIGTQISGVTEDGQNVEGVVDRVLVQDQEVMLGVGENLISLNLVKQIFSDSPVSANAQPANA